MNNKTSHIKKTPYITTIKINLTMCEKLLSMIHQLAEPLFEALTCSNNFLNDIVSISHGCGGIFSSHCYFSSLSFAAFVYAQLSHVPSQYFNQVEVWTLTEPLQRLDSLLFQTFCFLLCLGLLSCSVTQFWLSFSPKAINPRVLWVVQMQICILNSAAMFF